METLKGAIYTSKRRIYKDILYYESNEDTRIADKIMKELRKRNISKAKFAQLCGINRDTVLRYTGKKMSDYQMNIKTLGLMENTLGVEKCTFFNKYHRFIACVDGGKWLKEKRKVLGMTQKEFADRLTVPLYLYKAYEQGNTKVPYAVWNKLCSFF